MDRSELIPREIRSLSPSPILFVNMTSVFATPVSADPSPVNDVASTVP